MARFQKLLKTYFSTYASTITLSAEGTVQIFHALPAVRFSYLLQRGGTSFQDGVATGEDYTCVLLFELSRCDYSAA
jgi:hypothetical protein